MGSHFDLRLKVLYLGGFGLSGSTILPNILGQTPGTAADRAFGCLAGNVNRFENGQVEIAVD